MEMALAILLHNLVADDPIPPVVSKAKGQHVQSARRQGSEFSVRFADSAALAVAVAVSRVAWEPERRNGWTTVTSTAKGLESVAWMRTSAGRAPEVVVGSSCGRHPASADKANNVSRTLLCRRYRPAEAQDREWSPKKSMTVPQAAHTGVDPCDKAIPVRKRSSACQSGAENW